MDEKQKAINQYQKAYKELKIECNNLKKLIETTDPLDIDFNSKIRQINNLKDICNNLHYRIGVFEFD